uniref:dienelactone hydrolase family protein n=1 Tax=Pseudomonas aeruginosa TaxID=287 RepID=UPI001ABD0D2B
QAALGFCFGGCCALELARDGAELKAFVSFHGTLDTPDPAHARNIKGAVLVLDGASDPLVPREQLPAFAREMTDAGVDWQLTSYGGAVHSFTDPNAKVPGKMHYDARTSRRAFQAMDDLLAEVFA